LGGALLGYRISYNGAKVAMLSKNLVFNCSASTAMETVSSEMYDWFYLNQPMIWPNHTTFLSNDPSYFSKIQNSTYDVPKWSINKGLTQFGCGF
jgi:hypothetical protein